MAWSHCGVRCEVAPGFMGVPCGYVALPDGHPLSLASAARVERSFHVHGGVTYVGEKGPGREVGFDMGHHAGDISVGPDGAVPLRTAAECAAETERLAEQVLMAMGVSPAGILELRGATDAGPRRSRDVAETGLRQGNVAAGKGRG